MTETLKKHRYHEEASALVRADMDDVFAYLDDHRSLASHMGSGSSPKMGGGTMTLELDAGGGREIGSHIRMGGTAFGLKLFVDEVVTERTPPRSKAWQTVEQHLVVIGDYAMGFRIDPAAEGSDLTVWIGYDRPERNRWLGKLGGRMYARWCVRQMRDAAVAQFNA